MRDPNQRELSARHYAAAQTLPAASRMTSMPRHDSRSATTRHHLQSPQTHMHSGQGTMSEATVSKIEPCGPRIQQGPGATLLGGCVRGGLTAVHLAPTAVAAAHWCPHAENNQDLAAVKCPNDSHSSSPGVAHPHCGSLGAPRLAGACAVV